MKKDLLMNLLILSCVVCLSSTNEIESHLEACVHEQCDNDPTYSIGMLVKIKIKHCLKAMNNLGAGSTHKWHNS